tara:strand:- start:152 stop:460 length:309 start_codon:yes stop_codon:yes gene_type:complete
MYVRSFPSFPFFRISPFELNTILEEADEDDGEADGLIDYNMFLPSCVNLLQTFMARRTAQGKQEKDEKFAFEQAETLVAASKGEILQIASHLRTYPLNHIYL